MTSIPNGDDPASGGAYPYSPNKAAAIFFTAAFACSGLFHVFQCLYVEAASKMTAEHCLALSPRADIHPLPSRYRCFKVTALLSFCCAIEVAGLGTRIGGAVHPQDAQTYTASTLLIYLAP